MIPFLFTIIFLGHYQNLQPQPKLDIVYLPSITNTKEEFEIREIAYQEGFNQEIAVRIAKCESQLGKYKKNWDGLSATGLFQFMPTTWNNYCEGDINNNETQTKCFIKLYPLHKDWWACK